MSDTTLKEQKGLLRAQMKRKREEAFAAIPRAAFKLRDAFLRNVELPSGAIVGGYAAFGSEMDIGPLVAALREKGHVIALPVVAGRERPLVFRRYDEGDKLVRNAFGMDEPGSDAPVLVPSVLLVPFLAFDRDFYRLGYGGGYYDRTIEALRARGDGMAIGIGFTFQEVLNVPHDERDARLDKIATDLDVFNAKHISGLSRF